MNKREVINLVNDNLSDLCFTIFEYPDRWMMVMDDAESTQDRWLDTLKRVKMVDLNISTDISDGEEDH